MPAVERTGTRVAVIVPSYGGSDLLGALLASLRCQSFRDFSVTVVDNGSTDGLTRYVRESWAEVTLITLPRNVGVAAAMNRGIEATSSEFVALLNNDVELDPRWLERLVDALDRLPHAGSAAPKLLRHDCRDALDGTGDIIRWSGASTRRGHGEQDGGQYEAEEWIFSACGAAALYRRAAFEDVGLFDEDFFAYHEDVDWGFRAQLRGYRCRYVPAAVAYHVGSATTNRDNPTARRYAFLLRRNAIAVVVKNYPAQALVRHLHEIVGHHARWLIKSSLQGDLRIHLQAYVGAALSLPAMLAKRRQIQRRRVVEVRYLDTVISKPPRRGFRSLLRTRLKDGDLARLSAKPRE